MEGAPDQNHLNRKVDQEKKIEVVKEINRLDIQLQALEREKTTQIYSKKSEFHGEFQHLFNVEASSNNDRLKEKKKLKSHIDELRNQVSAFKRHVESFKANPSGVVKLKQLVEDVESMINSYKDQQRLKYEELMASERTLTQEIAILHNKYESWTQHASSISAKGKENSRSLANIGKSTLPEEVKQFEVFLERNGGLYGGWDQYDHQIFLRHWQTYKNRPSQLISVLRSAVPIQDEKHLQAHVAWYREYQRLEETKRAAIQEWKRDKQIEKELVTDKLTADDDTDPVKEKMKKIMESEREDRFSQLNSWKIQKEIERLQKQEENLKHEVDRHRKQKIERQKQLDVKEQVLEYRRQKEEDEEFLTQQRTAWYAEEESVRREWSARERSRFQERDRERVISKLADKQRSIDEEAKRKEMLNKLKDQVKVERDPARLYKPTEGWKSRLKDTSNSRSDRLLHIPHRAVPSWRQGSS